MLCVHTVFSYSKPICYNLYSRLISEKVEVEEGPRVCIVKPRVRSRLSTLSTSSDDSQERSSWRIYGAVLLNEEEVLIDEVDSSEEEVDGDGAEFIWRGGWNGWNTY